jgi:glycosyltransferase involved in cell wall biosynthesis
MKVVHCIGKLSGGGAETQLKLLKDNCRSESIQNVILTLSKTGIDSYADSSNIHTIKARSIIGRWIEIYKIFRLEKPDLIHIWIPAILPYFLIPALFFGKERIICGIRSVYRIEGLVRIVHYLLFFFGEYYISNVHPDDLKGPFARFSRHRFYYVPNGINYTYNDEAKTFEGRNRVLFVGRFIEEKNLHLLISAIEKLRADGHDFVLDICGDGPLRARIVEQIQQGNLGDYVHMHGFKRDLAPMYEQASVMVLPSLREGMPNVAFEAISFKKALVLSDIPQHTRWFQDGYNAILFTPDSSLSICRALLRYKALANSDLMQFNSRNAEVISKLSVPSYINRLLNVYAEILEKKKRS